MIQGTHNNGNDTMPGYTYKRQKIRPRKKKTMTKDKRQEAKERVR